MSAAPSQGALASGVEAARRSRGPFSLVTVSRWFAPPRWALALVALWLGLVGIGIWLTGGTAASGPPCLFRLLASWPCPTCGSGRGAAALLHGDLLGALRYNPLFFGLLLLGAAMLALRLVTAKRLAFSWGGRRRRAVLLACLGAGLLLGNWVYLVLAGI